MKITFYKYQGAGNDFILLDNRKINYSFSSSEIKKFCDRNFGVGADGFIVLKNHNKYDFEMSYYNCDGKISSMCGNGGRCVVHFANLLGIIESDTFFYAVDGVHYAKINKINSVTLKMIDIEMVLVKNGNIFINSGSPHLIIEKKDIDLIDVKESGFKIRNLKMFRPHGVNVNFVEKVSKKEFKIRTYERGVENETLSCGTGAVASAIAMHYLGRTKHREIKIITKGGELKVLFKFEKSYSEIFLEGPVDIIFKGEINI